MTLGCFLRVYPRGLASLEVFPFHLGYAALGLFAISSSEITSRQSMTIETVIKIIIKTNIIDE
jgi:hypothetical protein